MKIMLWIMLCSLSAVATYGSMKSLSSHGAMPWSTQQSGEKGVDAALPGTPEGPGHPKSPGKPGINPNADLSWAEWDDNVHLHDGLPVLVRDKQGGIIMRLIPGGTYKRGSATSGRSEESPPHRVQLSTFYMGEAEVTQGEWKKQMGANPSNNHYGDDCPVDNVSWYGAQAFCRATGLRLPTEAEWEYACLAGEEAGPLAGVSNPSQAGHHILGPMAWYLNNAGRKSHAVCNKAPNRLGLHDMYGNLMEWCANYYDASEYKDCANTSIVVDPQGPPSTLHKYRAVKGSSFMTHIKQVRPQRRYGYLPQKKGSSLGFRVARSVFSPVNS